MVALVAMSLLLGVGSVVYADQNCTTRWGEPIGIGCRTAAVPTSVVLVEVEETAGYAPECATRWGEPVGVGCRTAATVAKVSGEIEEAETEYLINCPTRWGEPIGVNCRVPVNK